MKTEQLQYVLELYKTGSISKTAKKFYMSRPNMSNSIRALENEVGFDILERGLNGVKFTERGRTFVHHCANIVKELDQVRALAKSSDGLQFGVAGPSFPPIETAFLRLCQAAEQREEYQQYQLSLFQAYQYESMNLLNQGKADLAITVSRDLRSPALLRELEERGLQYIGLCQLPFNVNLSQDHPLAQQAEFVFEKLREYPFVNYSTRLEQVSSYNRISEVEFISLSKLIHVENGDARTRIIANSSAYSVGGALPPEWAEEHGLRCIPIPDFTMELGLIRRSGEPESVLEQQYMTFLREELDFLVPSDKP